MESMNHFQILVKINDFVSGLLVKDDNDELWIYLLHKNNKEEDGWRKL